MLIQSPSHQIDQLCAAITDVMIPVCHSKKLLTVDAINPNDNILSVKNIAPRMLTRYFFRCSERLKSAISQTWPTAEIAIKVEIKILNAEFSTKLLNDNHCVDVIAASMSPGIMREPNTNSPNNAKPE